MSATTMAALAAVLLTYLAHSTLLLLGVWLLDRLVIRREAWRETLWKAALLGAVMTTVAAVALPARVAPRIELAALAGQGSEAVWRAAPEPVIDPVTEPDLYEFPGPDRAGDASPAPLTGAERSAAGAGTERVDDSGRATAPAPVAAPADGGTVPWLPLVLGLWAGVVLFLLIRLGVRHVRLYRVLRGRQEVTEAGLPGVLAELRRTAGVWRPVRLTSTAAIATPLVLGRSEICVPERLRSALSAEEQRAALAHELGHLARRDPAWQLLAMVLECVFFFQPLHRVARLRLRESAEYLADGWAVQHTGSRLGLARCLAEVAGWVAPSDEPILAGTVAMAEGGSPLLLRVRRLLEREPEPSPRAGFRAAAAVALVAVAAGFGPAVGPPITPAATSGPPSGGNPTGWDGYADRGQELSVIRTPAEGDLAARLAWAGAEAARRGAESYWVAWSVSSVVPAGTLIATGSRGVTVYARGRDALLRSRDGAVSVAGALGVEAEVGTAGNGQEVVVMALLLRGEDGPQVARLEVRSPSLLMTLGGTAYWLGAAAPAEGVRWLESVRRTATDRRVSVAAIDAAALHAGPEAVTLLRSLASSRDAGRRAREQAVEGLVWHPTDENFDLLVRIAREDGDRLIRTEAVETLGELDHPRAADVLRDLIRVDADPQVREEALESLAELRQDTTLVTTLLEVATSDPDEDMRREAVELLAELPADRAVPALRRLALESEDRTVLRQSAESLGEVGGPEAMAVLAEIVALNRHEEAVMEAVEAIAEAFPVDDAAAYLEEIARTHPSTRVRREAMEALADLRIGAASAEALFRMALHDDDPDLRRDAVEQLARLPSADAVPLLRRVAFESGDGTAERQAAESLGEVGTLEALAVLDEILARNPSEDASFQAVESIAENFSTDQARPRLEAVLRDHPSTRVRREALDRLADIGGP